MQASHTIKISDNINNLQVIGDSEYPNALQDTLLSAEIGSNVSAIGPSCFINCKNLEYVKLPKTCRYIGEYAFYGCENLKYVTCIDENDCYEIFEYGAHAFDGCNNLENISIKLSSAVSRDTTIGEYCFANCSNLKSFTQKGSRSFLGSYMFSGCNQLTSINLQNVTDYVQSYALANIPNLKSITIPNKIWLINEGMFAGDTSLSSVNISDGNDKDTKSVLLMIGDSAFANCNNLTSIILPKSITDISCCGNFMLKDSNICEIRFNGIPNSKFRIAGGKKISLEDGYIQDKTEFNAAIELAVEKNVPIILFTCHSKIAVYQEDICPACERLASQLRSREWKDFMQKNANKCIFVFATSTWQNALDSGFSSKNIKIPWKKTYYGKAACIWCKADGEISIIQSSAYHWGKNGDPSVLIQNITEFIANADPHGAEYVLNETVVNQSLTKRGSSLEQITYISKEGNPSVVTKDTYIETIPNTKVDTSTADNFRYGTWYYNAKELRLYADKNGIPVLCEYSRDGCPPCVYFKTNVFKNKIFQEWVMKRPYLFCRIEIEKNDNFRNIDNNPEAYYVDKEWAKELDPNVAQKPIPIFFWYWNQNGIRKVGDLSSWHFDPDAEGATPPFSMEEIMQLTDTKFNSYLSSDIFKRYQTYDLYSNAKDPSKIGQYANNVDNDFEGIMFPCDRKTSVDRYDITLALSGYPTIANGIEVGQVVPYENKTYYVYDFDAAQSYYPNAKGVIFKVETANEEHVVTHIIDAYNETETEYKDRTYKTNLWHNFMSDADATKFNEIIDEAENRSTKLVILKTNSEDQFNQIANTADFKALLNDLLLTYFIEVRSSDFSAGLGKAFKDFYAKYSQQEDSVHFPTWEEKTPLIFTYLRCKNCTKDGNSTPYVAEQIDPANLEPDQITKRIKSSFQTESE